MKKEGKNKSSNSNVAFNKFQIQIYRTPAPVLEETCASWANNYLTI